MQNSKFIKFVMKHLRLRSIERLFKKKPGTAGLTLSLLITVAFVLLIMCFKPSHPLISIEAESEFLAYKVIRPELSTIALEDVTPRNTITNCGEAHEGNIKQALLKPSQYANVRYRHSGDRISISVVSLKDHPSKIHFPDQTKCELPQVASFTFKKPIHGSFADRPLPIAGPCQIGAEPRVPIFSQRRTFDTMIGGTLRVFGRTKSFFSDSTLYPIKDAVFTLPAGGRLVSGDLKDKPSEIKTDASMYGFAIIDKETLRISVTTEAKDLRLFRPGRSSDAETFKLSLLSRLFNDPSIAIISFSIVVFYIAMQVICGWIDIWRKEK